MPPMGWQWAVCTPVPENCAEIAVSNLSRCVVALPHPQNQVTDTTLKRRK